MEKVIKKDFRRTKVIKLPVSGLEVEVYSSVLVGDAVGFTGKGDDVEKNLELLVKVIKQWNLFASETAEKPEPITTENIKGLPAPDFEHLCKEFEAFSTEQKKS